MHIVIADSSQLVLDIVTKQVKDSGNSVTTFADGAAARDYIHSDKPMDVLLTSLELPNVSGLELCWEIDVRAQTGNPVYVIVMSSSSDVSKLIEALDSGADDFLKKPFVAGELMARLRAAERTIKAQSELVRLASTDPLTGIANRRSFFEQSNQQFQEHRKAGSSAMIMLDIDHFKNVNDSYGHEAGDRVLLAVSDAIKKDDLIFGRLGGEEFAVFLPKMKQDAAHAMAEDMRNAISDLVIDVDGFTVSVTCSFGISEYNGDDNLDSLLKRADQALYAAKNNGRNQTIIWGTDDHQLANC